MKCKTNNHTGTFPITQIKLRTRSTWRKLIEEHKNEYPLNKTVSKKETVASENMKQTCGNITQLPKISIIRTSSDIIPASKSIHINHKNEGRKKHRKMKTIWESENRRKERTDVKNIETWNTCCLRRRGKRKKRKDEEKICVRNLAVKDGFDLDQREKHERKKNPRK